MSKVIDYYWRSRLDAGRALYAEWNPGIDYEGRDPAWPLHISRSALWHDYELWFEREWSQAGTSITDPGRVVDFFDHMRKYHFGRGRAFVHTRPVKIAEKYNGEWRHTIVRRKFIRMPDYDTAKQYWLDAK